MAVRAEDIVQNSDVSGRVMEVVEEVGTGTEKVPTEDGAAFVAIADARKLDKSHRLENRERGTARIRRATSAKLSWPVAS
jgi:hypothetical protein